MIVPLYAGGDYRRESQQEGDANEDSAIWRSPFSRDYGRIVHVASFRRLQGKTQVFPGHESDFFRNRLTHSLEVAQIAEGIAERLNATHPKLVVLDPSDRISTRLCASAALLHDLGHPPFGHNGERALDDAMRRHGGFEGNAQSLRIAARLEKKVRGPDEQPYGLDLTYRTLAAILKYDKKIPHSRRKDAKLVKGYYYTESDLVRNVKKSVAGLGSTANFRTVECSIMDLADDIAYSTFDLEDSLKASFLTPSDIFASSDRLLAEVADRVSRNLKRKFEAEAVLRVFADIFEPTDHGVHAASGATSALQAFIDRYRAYNDIANSGYLRTELSSQLVKEAINAVQLDYDEERPMLSKVSLPENTLERVEVLKQYTFVATIYSSRVKLPEYRGYEVVQSLFNALAEPRGHLLMPEDVRNQYESLDQDLDAQMRVVCDFVAGMTDRYAMEFFGRLHSDTAQSMFKPI